MSYSEDQIKALFREADTNKAGSSFGTLYRMELVQFLKKKGIIKYPEEVGPIIDKYDTSGDNKIQYPEFRNIVLDLMAPRPAKGTPKPKPVEDDPPGDFAQPAQQWLYLDNSQKQLGPFPQEKMHAWWTAGKLPKDLKVKLAGSTEEF